MNRSSLDDDALELLLADVLAVVEPVPEDALEAAFAAAGLGKLHEELATLVFDSGDALELVGMRGPAVESRLVSFVHDDVTLDLQLPADDQILLGHLHPAGEATVVVETERGTTIPAVFDEHGRFRVAVPEGALRVRVIGRLVTPFVSR